MREACPVHKRETGNLKVLRAPYPGDFKLRRRRCMHHYIVIYYHVYTSPVPRDYSYL